MRPILLLAAILSVSPASAAVAGDGMLDIASNFFRSCMLTKGQDVLLYTETDVQQVFDAIATLCQQESADLDKALSSAITERIEKGEADESMRDPTMKGLRYDMRMAIINAMIIERGRLRAVRNGTAKQPQGGDLNRSF